MSKVTLTNDDGSTQDFNDQAYTDAAVAAALANQAPAAPAIAEVDVVNSDGSEEKFVPQS